MTRFFTDPAHVALAFTLSVFAIMGATALAGAVRLWTRRPGRALHALTTACGLAALALLAVLSAGIDAGIWLFPGFAAALGALLFWLPGALVARVRPAWVDLVVILSVVAFLTAYAGLEEGGARPAVFPGLTLTGVAR